MRFKKRRIVICLSILLSFIYIWQPLLAKEEAVPYVISSYTYHMNVNDNGLLQIKEQLDVSNCEDLMLTRMLPMTYKIIQDSTEYEKTYDLKNVSVANHDYTVEEENGISKINIVLSKKSESITLSYDVQLKDFQLLNQQLLYYTLFTGFQGSILSYQAEITLPSALETPIQIVNEEGKAISDLQMKTEDDKVIISTSKSLPFGTNVSIQSLLPSDYFTFGMTIDYQLLATIFSVFLVCGTFLIYMSKEKTGNRKKLYLSHPPKGIPMILYGFIIDGYINEKDFFPLLIDWANRGYITIEESKQDIHIILRQELPVQAPAYEKLFFDAVFGQKTMVNLYDLENKDFSLIFDEMKEIVYDTLCVGSKHSIYHMHDVYHQIACCVIAGIPMFFAMLAALYSESNQFFSSLLPSIITWAAVSLSCIPWVYLVLKYPILSIKARKGLFMMIAVLQSTLLFIMGYMMLSHHMNFIYIIINIVMTVLFMLDLFVLDRRTKLGSRCYKQVKAFDNFVHQSRVAQIDELMYQEPHYYYYMLPYVASLDVIQMWSGKFTALMIEKPFWFMTPLASSQAMYWVEPLVYALEDIATAILQVPAHSKSY